MQIVYLADHLELAPVLAAWHHREWASLLPGWSLEQAEAELRSHINQRCVPTTFVALEGGCPVGSASLIESDLDGWERLTPWLASVYVTPECRGRGIGSQLINRAVEEARAISVPTIYLWTAGHEKYFERLRWEPMQKTTCHGHGVLIMRMSVLEHKRSADP